jgi:tetratricopeptide (TPR) repeat protein
MSRASTSPPGGASSTGPVESASPGEPQAVTRQGLVGSRWTRYLPATIIVCAAVVAYANSFNGAFVFDDIPWIIRDPSVHRLWPVTDVLFSSNPNFVSGRPIINLTIAANYAVGGVDPRGYHAVNIAIHILAGLTLFGIVRRSLLAPVLGVQFAATATPLALAVALVWVVHPLQTAAVTYIIQRTEALAGLFYLLTLYCVIRGAISPNALRWYVAAFCACFLGMGTKEVVATAPVIMLLYDRTFLSGSFAAAFQRRWGLYAALIATWGVVAWTLLATDFHTGSTGSGAGGFTPLTYAMTQPGVIVHYLKLAFWPSGMSLDYGWPVAGSLSEIVLPSIVVAMLAGLTVWGLVKNSPLGFLGACFFVILAPTSSFVPIKDAAFDHRMYLPLAAVIGCVIIGGWWVWNELAMKAAKREVGDNRRSWILPLSALTLAIIGLSWATIRRNDVFRSGETVWRDVLENDSSRPRPHNNLAANLIDEQKYDEAIEHCRIALSLTPGYADAENNIGRALMLKDKIDEAIPWFEQALQHYPGHRDALMNLADALVKKGRVHDALSVYGPLAKIDPEGAQTHLLNLADSLAKKKDNASALDVYETYVSIAPQDAEARFRFANCLHEQGTSAEEMKQLEKAVELAPDHAEAHNNLAALLARQGRTAEAVEHFQKAIALNADHDSAWFNLGMIYYTQRKTIEAERAWRQAVRANPNAIKYLNALALALATSAEPAARNGPEAVELAKRAVELSQSKPDPNVIAILAAAYAEAGDFSQAVVFARQARELALAQHQDSLAEQLRDRIKLYESHQPFHEAPH